MVEDVLGWKIVEEKWFCASNDKISLIDACMEEQPHEKIMEVEMAETNRLATA